MKKHTWILLFSFLTICSSISAQKFENLAQTPPMGWNSWNKFACNINEQIIKEVADAMVNTGLRDAGYTYINLDDCWQGKRDSLGFITANPQKFPSGQSISRLCSFQRIKIRDHSDVGRETCGGYPGSLGHEYQDAVTYAHWGVDYLKYDWCNTENVNPIGAYSTMRDAIRSAGRPIVFSMCEWGDNKPWRWAKKRWPSLAHYRRYL